MRARRWSLAAALTLCLVTTATVNACAGPAGTVVEPPTGTDPVEQVEPPKDPEPDPELDPEPDPELALGPDGAQFPSWCVDLYDPRQKFPTFQIFDRTERFHITAEEGFGPVSLKALEGATDEISCMYGPPNSGNVVGFSLFELPSSDLGDLRAALERSAYIETTQRTDAGNSAQLFSFSPNSEHAQPTNLRIMFVGDYVYATPVDGDLVRNSVIDYVAGL